MKVLITGSRYWKNRELTKYVIHKLPDKTILIHGDCKGADRMAGYVALQRGFVVKEYPAKWDLYGNSAGSIRNSEMLEKEHLDNDKIDLVIALHEDIENSKWTKDMLRKISKENIYYILISNDTTFEQVDTMIKYSQLLNTVI